jgi:uncharacterized damage-inducible protein DinB
MQTRQRVFDAVRPLSHEQYHRSFPFGIPGGIAATLTHIMISEWYYIERLEGRDVPHYEQWPIKYEPPHTPKEFATIEKHWLEQSKRIRAVVVDESSGGDWSRTITWLSFPDDTRGNKRFRITCTAGDLITQLALHEVHHRAQILAMLRELAAADSNVKPVEDLDYNALMYQRVEATETT